MPRKKQYNEKQLKFLVAIKARSQPRRIAIAVREVYLAQRELAEAQMRLEEANWKLAEVREGRYA